MGEKEFDLLKQSRLNQVLQKKGILIVLLESNLENWSMAKMLFCLIILDETTINAITLEDLKDYYNRNFHHQWLIFKLWVLFLKKKSTL
jgi:hypothetical protein